MSTDLATIKRYRQRTLDSMFRGGPEHFDMNVWGVNGSGSSVALAEARGLNFKTCGTTACIAGHAVHANPKLLGHIYDGLFAPGSILARKLGVTMDLFYRGSWPTYAREVLSWNPETGGGDEWEWACSLMLWFVEHPAESEFPSHEAYNAWVES